MATTFTKLAKLARSPQGRRMMNEAQRMARNPETRRKITDLRARLAKR